MHQDIVTWHSPRLQREMTLQVVGRSGARVLVFPTSMGTWREWTDRQMHEVLRDHLENGWIQLFCLDQPHHENWGNDACPVEVRARVHLAYYDYVQEEVLPFAGSRNPNPYLIATGASLGATHAMSYGLRFPHAVNRILGMSGMYDLKRLTGGWSNGDLYAVNPMDFMTNEHDAARLVAFRRQDIIMAIGRDDPMYGNNAEFSGRLWGMGIGNALRVWDGHAHDWPWWERMVRLYMGGHD